MVLLGKRGSPLEIQKVLHFFDEQRRVNMYADFAGNEKSKNQPKYFAMNFCHSFDPSISYKDQLKRLFYQ